MKKFLFFIFLIPQSDCVSIGLRNVSRISFVSQFGCRGSLLKNLSKAYSRSHLMPFPPNVLLEFDVFDDGEWRRLECPSYIFISLLNVCANLLIAERRAFARHYFKQSHYHVSPHTEFILYMKNLVESDFTPNKSIKRIVEVFFWWDTIKEEIHFRYPIFVTNEDLKEPRLINGVWYCSVIGIVPSYDRDLELPYY